MNIALAGLPAREETALRMLVRKTLPNFQCIPVSTGRRVPLPPADLYVLDLAGRGLARWTQEAQDSLILSLNGAPAVLVAPAFDETWLALDAPRMKSQSLVMLRKPYGVENMRTALLKAAPRKPALAVPTTPLTPTRAPVPTASAAAPVPAEIAPLSIAEFQIRLRALPAAEPKLFLCKLAAALARRHPFEVRVTFLNRLIFSPDEQWAASNTTLPILQNLCKNDELATDISIDVIDSMDVLKRAQRLDMPVQPLESFLGTMMHCRLGNPR